MDPELWRRVEEIFHQALEREGPARAAFLDGACSDPDIRREVEALLAHSAECLLDRPAESLVAGAQLGPYRVERSIGSGGMGTVYKALDTRLNRAVAIKIAAARFSARFAREARAIGALNHPNVCTLYDIGPNYLVMEFVEGASLLQLLRERRLPVEEALQYALQIAAAMEAAHAAGIVHRDLKPGNVIVTGSGLVKVLDFGLAKMTVPPPQRADSESTATAAADSGQTRAGAVMGTPAYMSPEQALGKPLDPRSDVFAFGVLLYEMLTGRRAFSGDSALEVLSGIIHVQVPPPSTSNPEAGLELDSLVARCLRKNPAERFPGMTEVRRELKTILSGTSATVSAVGMPPPIPKRRWRREAALAAGVLALTAGMVWWRSRALTSPDDTGEAPKMMRVTSDPGLSIDPAISQDGKLVAYASDRSGEGKLDIWLRQIGGGDPLRLTRDAADNEEPNFSPDGTHIVFRSERNGGGLYIVPTTGGEERRIADGGRRPQYSPDGTKVAYWTGPADPFPLRDGIGKIFVLDLLTSTTRQIRPEFSAAVHPVWSPDGNKILFAGAQVSTATGWNWWISPLDGGPPVSCPVMPPGHLFDPFAWQGDWVYFMWEGDELNTVSRLAVNASTGKPSGKPRRLSAATADASSPAVSKTGALVFSVIDTATNLYTLPLDADAGNAKGGLQPISKNQGYNAAESISADGTRLAFITLRSGDTQVWGMDLSTGRSHAVTEGGQPKGWAQISADGASVAWRELVRSHGVFVSPFDGGPSRQLCPSCVGVRAWSPDGKYVLLEEGSPLRSIGLMEMTSGKSTVYLRSDDSNLRASSISGDGQWIAFTAERTAPDFAVYVAPFDPKRALPKSEWVEVMASPDVHPDPRWSPDGNLLYFSSEKDGYNCVWAMHLNPRTKRPQGKLFPVRHFHSPSLQLAAPSLKYQSIALARDRIVVSLRERSGGIWMLQPQSGK